MLCISDVLASGSVRGFLAGKHFNRCKRLHPLFATALEILHFRGFIKKHGWMTDDIMAFFRELGGNVCMESLSAILQTDACTRLLDIYDEYYGCTRRGEHGKTAMFWMTLSKFTCCWIGLVGQTMLTCNIYALGHMLSVFFATHRPNYARWMTRYP